MLRARVVDPAGPRWWRAATALAPAALVPWTVPFGVVPAVVALMLALAWWLAAGVLRPRLRPREASVVLELGAVHVVGAGPLSQTVRARDLKGASTARTERGLAIALVRRDALDRPLVLEVSSAQNLDRVRRALGVGHGGFGALAWPAMLQGASGALRLPLAIGWTIAALMGAAGATWVLLQLLLPVVPLTLVALVATAVAADARHGLVLTPWGVQGVPARPVLSYADVLDARRHDGGLTLVTREGAALVPMPASTRDEIDHAAAQILSASRRARGEAEPTPDASGSLAALDRREEPARAWLERLDAAAATMTAGAHYRAAGVHAEDLWRTLESPEAPAPLRAAAARVLARVAPEEAGRRIAGVLACERDDATRARIRVALEEDVDAAALELDRLERG